MNPVTRNRVIGLALAVLLFAADQASKGYVLHGLKLRLYESHYLLPVFQFTLTHNYGVSLGMFTAASEAQRWGLVAVTALIAVVVTVWMLREKKLGDIVALALILGGALGNIKDRYDLGYVVDFLDLHLDFIPPALCPSYQDGMCRPFLIFNLADAAITIGVIIILARSLLIREKAPKPAETAPELGHES